MDRKVRVLVSKAGPDSPDRGATVLAYGLRDAGLEVIFLGIRHTPEQIADTAVQEDVAVVSLSLAPDDPLMLIQQVLQGLKQKGGEDVALLVEGTIPDDDRRRFKAMGVLGVAAPETRIEQVVQMITNHAAARARESHGAQSETRRP